MERPLGNKQARREVQRMLALLRAEMPAWVARKLSAALPSAEEALAMNALPIVT